MLLDCDCIHIKGNEYFRRMVPQRVVANERVHHSQINDNADDIDDVFDSHLQPSLALNSSVNHVLRSWRTTQNVTHIIGVHIRSAFMEHQSGIFQQFLTCIEEVRQELHNENVGVFVAADSAIVREEASSVLRVTDGLIELPSPISVFPNDTGGGLARSIETVQEAALELFLLGSSDSIFVAGLESTFGEVALLLAQRANATVYFVGTNQCKPAPLRIGAHLRTRWTQEICNKDTSTVCTVKGQV